MKATIENKLLAVIRVRGRVGVRQSIKETLSRLNLNRINNLAILFGNRSNIGMIRKCNDFVTYGEISDELLQRLFSGTGTAPTKEDIEGLRAGKKPAKSMVKIPIRLHPPRHGYEGIKKGYSSGGALGYRGSDINKLIARMIQ